LFSNNKAEAAQIAPVDDREEFIALIDVLGCKRRKIQDLLGLKIFLRTSL
jgi:hypothetical protein